MTCWILGCALEISPCTKRVWKLKQNKMSETILLKYSFKVVFNTVDLFYSKITVNWAGWPSVLFHGLHKLLCCVGLSPPRTDTNPLLAPLFSMFSLRWSGPRKIPRGSESRGRKLVFIRTCREPRAKLNFDASPSVSINHCVKVRSHTWQTNGHMVSLLHFKYHFEGGKNLQSL